MGYRRFVSRWDKARWRFRHYVLGKRQWYMTWLAADDAHVLPILDYFVHEASSECLCHPRVELIASPEGDQWITTHQSFDSRKQVEL